MMLRVLLILTFLLAGLESWAQDIDWQQTAKEAVRTLKDYIRIDTSNPPGEVTSAAELLSGVLHLP